MKESQGEPASERRKNIDQGSLPPTAVGSGDVKNEAKQEQRRHSSSQASMWDECRLLRRLRHPNIVCVQDVVDAQLSRPLKSAGGSAPNLRRAISGAGGRLSQQRAQVILWQLSSGVAYIHDQRVAHRNLKPENIMVDEDDAVKLANFKLAVKLGNPCRDKCGTMPFVAPEVLAGRRYDASASDVWAVGVVLAEMLCGINKVPSMLQWGNTSSPSSERARDLEAYFRDPKQMLVSLEADLGSLDNGLDELFPGLLTVAPEERWSAARARDCRWASSAASRSPCKAQAAGQPFNTQPGGLQETDQDCSDGENDTQNGGTGGTPRVVSGGLSSNHSQPSNHHSSLQPIAQEDEK